MYSLNTCEYFFSQTASFFESHMFLNKNTKVIFSFATLAAIIEKKNLKCKLRERKLRRTNINVA